MCVSYGYIRPNASPIAICTAQHHRSIACLCLVYSLECHRCSTNISVFDTLGSKLGCGLYYPIAPLTSVFDMTWTFGTASVVIIMPSLSTISNYHQLSSVAQQILIFVANTSIQHVYNNTYHTHGWMGVTKCVKDVRFLIVTR